MELTFCGETSAADWIVESPLPWTRLVTFGPDAFPAHARLRFIPDPTRPDQSENDVHLPEDHPDDLSRVRRALRQLARFTGTPQECYFCFWEGHPAAELPRTHPVDLVHRRYALLRGPLSAFDQWEETLGLRGSSPPPAFAWPADHAWILTHDVDSHWAGIGAEAPAIAALAATPGLDIVASDPAGPQPTYR